MKEKKESKRERQMREEGLSEGLPMNIAIGWVEQSDGRKDIIDLAKGHIDTRFGAKDAAWYGIMPFMGGWFWEAHEGGPGKGYLGAIVAEMTANQGGEYWVPAGPKKVLKVMMRDGKPFPIILSESESLKVRNSGQAPLMAKGRLVRFASRGTGMFIFGATLAGASAVYMLATMGFYLSVWQPGPMVRAVDLAQMPHSQWSKVENTDPEHIISKLEMKNGVWQQAETRRHIIPELEKERQNGREINASFDKQNFGFETKTIGDKIGSPAVSAPTDSMSGDGTATAIPAVTVPTQPPALPPAVPRLANPAATPSPVQPSVQPGAQSPASSTGSTVDPGVERQQRVMEQLRQLRERNAAAQKQTNDTVNKVDGQTPAPVAAQPATPAEPTGAKK
jgi:hypothetical protein